MAGFGAKVKLTVDKSGKSEFNNQINSMINQIKISNKFTVLKKDMDRVTREMQTMLNNEQLTLKIAKIDCSAAVADVRKQLQGMLSALSVSNGVNITGLRDFLGADGMTAALQQTATAADAAVAKMVDAKEAAAAWAGQVKVLNSISQSLASTYKSGLSGKNMIADSNQMSQITAQYNVWQQKIEQVKSSRTALSAEELTALQQEGVAIQRKITQLQNEQAEQQRAAAAARKKADAEEAAARKAAAANREELASIKQIATLQMQMSRYLNSNSKLASGDLGAGIRIMLNELNSGIPITVSRLNEMSAEFSNIRAQATMTGKTGRSALDAISNAYQRFGGWTLVTRSLTAAIHSVREMIDNVTDLDTAMTELKKVTDETDETYARFFNESVDRAKSLGATVTDTITASADFARLGYNLDEAANLADAALVYKNVGDGIEDISVASESIISTMKAFGIEANDAMQIVDAFNEVGNNFAISSAGIGDALVRSASGLAAANNTMEESIALITAMNSTVQDTDKVGTTLKTVSMYLRAAKVDAEEAGISTDGMASSVSKLRESILTLTKEKVDIMLDETTFKSTYQIMKELSEVWEDISDVDQAALLELIGGKRNSDAVMSLISNFEVAEDVLKTATESAGSALAENEKYLDSIKGKLSEFQAAFEAMSAAFIDSEFVKGIVSGGTAILETLTAIAETLGSIPTLVAAITTAVTIYKSAKGNSAGLFTFSDGEVALTKSLDNLIQRFNRARTAGMDFATAMRSATNSGFADAALRINAYNGQLGTSAEAQAIFMSNLETTNSTLADYLKSLNGGQASLKGYQAYCKQAGISVKSMGASSKLAAVGVTVLNTALNMLISLGVTLAIQAIISAITSLVNKAKEAREAAMAAGTEARENAEGLYDLASAYIELGNAMDAGTGSRQEFMSLQDELIAYLGLEGKSVRELQGDYDSLRESIIAAARQQLQTDISVGMNAASSAKVEAVKKLGGPLGGEVGSYLNAYGEGAKEALAYLEELGFSGIDNTGTEGGLIFLPNGTIDDLTEDVSFDELMENYRYLEDAMNAVSKKFGGENPAFKVLSDAYNSYSNALKDAIEHIDSTNESIANDMMLAQQMISNPTTQEEFEAFRKDLIASVENSAQFDENGSYSAEAIVDKVLADNTQYSEFLSALKERETTAAEIKNKMQTIAEALVPKNYEQYEEGTSAHFHAVDAWTAEAEEVKNKLRELSDEEFEIAYNTVITEGATTWEDISAAIEKYNSEQEIARRNSEQLKTSISSLWQSDDFSDAKEDLIELAESVNGISPEKIEELAEESDALAAILETDGMNAEFLAYVLQNIATGSDGLSLITEDALKLNDALEGMAGQFDKVTIAKSKYDEAMSIPEKDEDFRSYAEAFEALNAEFEAGTTNSNAFWAAAEFLFGSEQLAAWGWSDGLNEIYSAMEKNKTVFQDADSAGAGFIDRLYKLYQAGVMVNENGEKLLQISRDSTGAYDFDIDPENIEEIAEKMGITEEAVLACLQALSMWGEVDFYDMTEVSEVIEEIGLSAEIAGKKAVNVSALTDQLISLGKTDKDIYDVLTRLKEIDGIVLLDAETSIDNLTQSLVNLELATSDGVSVSVNTDGLSDLMSQLNFTKEQAESLITKLGEADNITLTNASGEVQDVAGALEYINTLDFATVTSNVDGVSGAIQDVNEESTDDAVSEIEGIGTAADTAAQKVENIRLEMQKLNGTTATVTVDVKRRQGILGMLGFANGTNDAPAGDALVGEEGAELVKSGNRAYLVGVDGPEITKLQKGDQVFPADETKKILRGSGKKISGFIPAYADGRATTSGLRVETNKKGEVGTPYTYKAKVDADTSDLEDKLEDTLKKMKEEIDEIIRNFEHSIFLLEKNGGDAADIVAIYRQMQEAVHAKAEEYRKLGLNDNSEYIQDLQKQWWDYEDNIRDTITKFYEDIVAEKENLIGKNERLFSESFSNKDRAKAEEYAANIIQLYREMQETVHEQAEYYRSLGYSETSDELSELGELWWDYADKIKDVKDQTVENLLDMVTATSDAVDEIQNVFDTLKEAADEYAANGGFISVDAFQEIVELGPQYMQYLRDENGLLIINEESINRVIAAKTQQLALENAMAYVERLRLALNGESLEELNALLYATTEGTNATWGLVYANLALLNLNGDQYQAALHNINAIRSLADNAISGLGKVAGTVSDELNDMKDGLDSILKYVMDMLKQRIEDEIDALEEMKDSYAEIIELRKESLRAAQEEGKYQDEVADKIKEIAKLQERINALSLDDSRDAQSQKIKLEEEMANLQKELADTQSDYAVDAQEDSLDKMQDAYEKEKDKEIAILEESISSYQKLYDMAIDYIESHWDTLYSELIAWNTEYGDVLNSEITTAWDNCLEAARRYGSYVAALGSIDSDIAAANGSSNSGNSSFASGNYSPSFSKDEGIRSIISRMYANSQAHHTASPARKKELSDENLRLGAQLAQYGITAMRDQNGYWHINSMTGPGLFDVYSKYTRYHDGGVAGDQPTLKQNEVLAILEKGETILDKKKEEGLYKLIDFTSALSQKFGDALSSFDLPGILSRMRENFSALQNRSLNNVTATKNDSIHFGDVYIYGGNEDTVQKHVDVSRKFVNEIIDIMNIRK